MTRTHIVSYDHERTASNLCVVDFACTEDGEMVAYTLVFSGSPQHDAPRYNSGSRFDRFNRCLLMRASVIPPLVYDLAETIAAENLGITVTVQGSIST